MPSRTSHSLAKLVGMIAVGFGEGEIVDAYPDLVIEDVRDGLRSDSNDREPASTPLLGSRQEA